MTVSELIESLKKLPQDARVLVNGYEGDFTEIDKKSPRMRLVHLNSQESSYCGEHVDCDAWSYRLKNQEIPEWSCYVCNNNIENKVEKPPVWVVLIER